MKREKACFEKESDLCALFIQHVGEGWVPYPETAGFDILLVRKSDGLQVGVEAKLRLNSKAVSQITEGYYDCCRAGPDLRAILVPLGCTGSMSGVCDLLGITVIEMRSESRNTKDHQYEEPWFSPALPRLDDTGHWRRDWHEWCPVKRCDLPEYLPDVQAGTPSPLKLSEWKIKAIKVCIILEKRGYVTRQDFKELKLDHRRWLTPGVDWLRRGDRRGVYILGPCALDLRAKHPTNYEQILDDYERWAPPEPDLPAKQENLL